MLQPFIRGEKLGHYGGIVARKGYFPLAMVLLKIKYLRLSV
jgi:hypothetical protein